MEATLIDHRVLPRPEEEAPGGLEAVIRRLEGGDGSALAELYDRCADELYGLALWRCGHPEDAADAVQDVFVRLARDPAPLLRARDPRRYLLAMAHNAAVSIQRRRRDHAPLDGLVVADPSAGPEAAAAAREISQSLGALPPPQREAIWLRHVAGLSFREIGAVTGVPTFTAASRCRLGMARLRRILEVAS